MGFNSGFEGLRQGKSKAAYFKMSGRRSFQFLPYLATSPTSDTAVCISRLSSIYFDTGL